MAWAVVSLLNRQWHLHNKQEEPLRSKALPQVLKLLAPRGALAQYDASGVFLMIGSLQVYKSEVSVQTMSCISLLGLTSSCCLGVYAPAQPCSCSWLCKVEAASQELWNWRECATVQSLWKLWKVLNALVHPSLPSLKEKRPTVFKIWYFFQSFLARGLPWGTQISSLWRH